MEDYINNSSDFAFIANDVDLCRNKTLTYIQLINETLDGKYCPGNRASEQKASGLVNLNLSFYKNNLNAKNWYYGTTTASDYKIYLFTQAATYNLTNCPIETPFTD